MIQLKPILEIPKRQCPQCDSELTAIGFLIPGMRNLADFECPQCQNRFFGDLPSGQGLYSPILLNKISGEVYDDYGVSWFAEWLADSYSKRKNEPISFEVKKLSTVKDKVILLNCLDTLYGHSLLKLLNAQYYLDFQTDASLIVILPKVLEWMLPDGVAEVWIIDLPLPEGTFWNDWLAGELNERLKPFSEVYLSTAFSHPHSEDFDIERFTRIKPFPLENFGNVSDKPVVTVIWREDRLWKLTHEAENTGIFGKFKRRQNNLQKQIDEQRNKVIGLAKVLRDKFPAIDFAVAGIGNPINLPDWIKDLRLTKINIETERSWCERYAISHIVIGVHGSNMLLPSAHAGGVIELIDTDRQGNFLQDILFRPGNVREIMFRYRFVSHSTTPEDLARLVSTILHYEDFRKLMSPEFCRHQENYNFEKWLSGKRSGKRFLK